MPESHIVIERPEFFSGIRVAREIRRAPGLVLVMGTSHGEWALPGSPFRTQVLDPSGAVVAARVFGPEPLWFPRDDWRRIGDELAGLLQQGSFNLLVHSHGLQPAALAVAQSRAVCFVSISGPVRRELRATYAEAAYRSARVTQIADAGTDATQIAGQVFGRTAAASATTFLGIRSRDFPHAPNVVNVRIPGVGHSGLLYEERHFETARQWIVPALTVPGEQMRRA